MVCTSEVIKKELVLQDKVLDIKVIRKDLYERERVRSSKPNIHGATLLHKISCTMYDSVLPGFVLHATYCIE